MQKRTLRRAAFVIVAALAATGIGASRINQFSAAASDAEQTQAPTSTAAEPKMEQHYKNIQALKGVPASQMRPLMNYISASLGMGCADCHVRTGDQWEFEKDDNPHKKTARQMITMTMEMNKQFFNGRMQVTCYTCHSGHDHPVSIPPLPRVMPQGPAPRPAGAPPKPEEILAKYTQAVGGKEAVEKIKTRVIKGNSVAANGQNFPLEIQTAGSDKYTLSVALPQGASAQKYTGLAGWLKNSREDRAMESADLAKAKSLAWSLEVLQLKEPYPRLGFGGVEKIGDREQNVLRGALPDKRRVRFFFDKEIGLLTRRVILVETVIGIDTEQTDYEDYREVEGVKVPFSIKTLYLDNNYSSTRKFTEIKHNAKVDEAQFALPTGK